MNTRTWGVALAVLGTVITGAPAAAAPAGWQLTLLPMPAGHEDSSGYFTGTDGRGGYSGFIQVKDGAQVVTWTDGRPTLRGLCPARRRWPVPRGTPSRHATPGTVARGIGHMSGFH